MKITKKNIKEYTSTPHFLGRIKKRGKFKLPLFYYADAKKSRKKFCDSDQKTVIIDLKNKKFITLY